MPWMASMSHAPFLRGTLDCVLDATQDFKKSSAKFLQQMTACTACRVELSPRSDVKLDHRAKMHSNYRLSSKNDDYVTDL
jgi:hypothetical protein